MAENTRNRMKPVLQNGTAKHDDEKIKDTEFLLRESPLTNLLKDSAHIRAIYHIFIVILVLILFDTLIFDLVETGKINVGVRTIRYGFGDVARGGKLWLYMLSVAVMFYPLLLLYVVLGKRFEKNPGMKQLWIIVGVFGLMAVQYALFVVPVWDLCRQHLALGSSVTVTTEMCRFAMKIHAAAVTCGPRCFGDSLPMPTFQHYMYFIFAPTLLYRDQYPRTKRIRWGVAVRHFGEVAAIIFYHSFLWDRFILPQWSDYGKEESVQLASVVRKMFACVLPGVISFLCGFYCLLHAWCNAFAEIMRFGDRLFYEEWWTVSRFSAFFRLWNRVVHSWLREYIYMPLAPRAGRGFSTFAVFLVSSLAHEMILALSFGFFYPVLLIQFGVFALSLLPLTSAIGKRFPNALNMFIWLSLFLGNGMLWSFYPMEHYARKNCPPSEGDSFFIPKSWSCPKTITKPDWKFFIFQLN